MSQESPPLPDTTMWQPRRSSKASSIAEALLARCRALEVGLATRVEHEKDSAIDAFDSGVPVEDVIREAISSILPKRYEVGTGTLVDSEGATAGDVDIVVFNSTWFPEVKAPATVSTRRRLLPIEGVYAVAEVKQTLSFSTLDEAMEKLVQCHRLHRIPTSRDRLVENRDFEVCPHGLSNPLYSLVIAPSTSLDLESLAERFFNINRTLQRLEVVRAMCVLGCGAVLWAVSGEDGPKPALFMGDDLLMPIAPALFPAKSCESPLYVVLENLMLHLYKSVLGPEDIVSRYGPSLRTSSLPKDTRIVLAPDS